MNEPVNIVQAYRIGSMDQRVQILAPTETQETNGAVTQTWGEYATRYASVTPIGGSEPILADVIQPVSRARFVFRYDSTINEKYRLVWNSHTYNIVSINVIPRNRFLEILAESNTLSGTVAVDYGDYYTTNSLRIRHITASAVTTVTPTQAEITSDVGLTAVLAGAGYLAIIDITGISKSLMIYSDGTYWYYSYVDFTPSTVPVVTGAMAGAIPTSTELNTATGLTPITAGSGYTFHGIFTRVSPATTVYYTYWSDGTNWIGSQSEAIVT